MEFVVPVGNHDVHDRSQPETHQGIDPDPELDHPNPYPGYLLFIHLARPFSCYFGRAVDTPQTRLQRESLMKPESLAINVSVAVALGAGIGSTVGAAFGNIAIGVAFGPAIALVICLAIYGNRVKGDSK